DAAATDAGGVPAFAGQDMAAAGFLVTVRSRLDQDEVAGVTEHQDEAVHEGAAARSKSVLRPDDLAGCKFDTNQGSNAVFGLTANSIEIALTDDGCAPMTLQDVGGLEPELGGLEPAVCFADLAGAGADAVGG